MPGIADLLPSLLTSSGAPGSMLKGASVPPPGGGPAGFPLLPAGKAVPPNMPSAMAAGMPQFPPSTPILEGGAGMAPPAPGPAPEGSAAGTTTGADQGMPNQGVTPPPPQYETVTQSDGSILLHIKNPDGSLGPAVKIVRAPKRALNDEAANMVK